MCLQHPAITCVLHYGWQTLGSVPVCQAVQAVSLKIVTDGPVLPPFLRSAVATSITSVKLCNKLNSWAASPPTVIDFTVSLRAHCAELRKRGDFSHWDEKFEYFFHIICKVLHIWAHFTSSSCHTAGKHKHAENPYVRQREHRIRLTDCLINYEGVKCTMVDGVKWTPGCTSCRDQRTGTIKCNPCLMSLQDWVIFSRLIRFV